MPAIEQSKNPSAHPQRSARASLVPDQRWGHTLLVLGAGGILGAFLSRLLAELPAVQWPFYRWELSAALTLTVGGLGLALYRSAVARARPAYSATFLPLYLLAIYLVQPGIDLLQAILLLSGAILLTLLLAIQNVSAIERYLPFALAAFTLTAYLLTLTPGVGTRDGYELQAASATLGFAHPTGYPLFPILGRLWLFILPIGSIAWRINVLCALFAAVGSALVYCTARRVLENAAIAAISGLLFAFSHTLWRQAVRPEKYTLNALFVALVLYIAFGTTEPREKGPHPHLRWLALAYGLSLGHHRTMLMLAPALAVYLLWRDPGLLKRPKTLLSALGIALAPLLIYLYIPWRAAAQGWYMTPNEFIQYVLGTYYGPAVRLMDWASPDRAAMFWRFTVAQFRYPGIALGLLGLATLGYRRQWRFLACTLLAYGAYYFWGTVWYAYYNDVNSFIPNHMLLALWIGSGIWALWRLSLGVPSRHVTAAFWSAVALLPLSLIWTNAPQVDARSKTNLAQWGEYAIAQDIAPGATILADREKHPPLDYFARVEGQRPDVDVVILGDEKAYLDRLVWDQAHQKTVYLARFLPGLDGPFHLRSLGPLIEVAVDPMVYTLPAQAVATFGDQIELLEHRLEGEQALSAGDQAYVTLYWRAPQSVPANYQVNLRLVSATGHVWWRDRDHPVGGMYPTISWKPGEIVRDWHSIPVAKTLPPGTYTLEVGLFPPFSERGLSYQEQEEWFSLRRLEILAPEKALTPPHRLRAIAPGQWQIVGYDLPAQAAPGSRVPLDLYWQALTPLQPLEIGTRMRHGSTVTSWRWEPPARGDYPSTEWPLDRTIVTRRTLEMPAKTGEVTIQVAVRHKGTVSTASEDRQTLFPHWLAGRVQLFSLPLVQLAGPPPTTADTANYGDRILLQQIEIPDPTLRPSSALVLDVTWQCLRNMDRDYTLFVQLIAPDGMLKGQIDVWPQEGTHPTSNWRVGETIEDSYLVPLDPDAPPGNYRIAVGWYLLETMRRLPVLDEKGQALDDKVLIPGVTVQPAP